MKKHNKSWLFRDNRGFYRIAIRRKRFLLPEILPDKFTDKAQADYVRKYHIN